LNALYNFVFPIVPQWGNMKKGTSGRLEHRNILRFLFMLGWTDILGVKDNRMEWPARDFLFLMPDQTRNLSINISNS
jgi:hypothetical protein